jgi:hypothetical protein
MESRFRSRRWCKAMKQRPFRQNVSRAAKLFLGGTGSLSGRILNISRGGAKVYIWAPSWIPHGFDLLDVFTGVRRRAKVVWRSPEGMGVSFVDKADWPRPRPPRPAPVFGTRQPRSASASRPLGNRREREPGIAS